MKLSHDPSPRLSSGVILLLLASLILAIWLRPHHAPDQPELILAAVSGSSGGPAAASVDLLDTRVLNPVAYVVPQCYVLPSRHDGVALNPCYTCHQRGDVPNFTDDSDLQQVFEMADAALESPWHNLLEDRRARIERMDDVGMRSWVRTSNYQAPDGSLILARRLTELPEPWDLDGDHTWDGYVPDAYFRFDDQGFDLTPRGGYSGWRAFAYYPLPGTYWPTNGSAGDVLIRLADPFRRNAEGQPSQRVYRLNLAIVEALIKRADVVIDPVDEHDFGVDLDKDGMLGRAERVRYDWAPLEGRRMTYVGLAGKQLADGRLHLAAGLFPEGTELMQSLRYLEADAAGRARAAARMKELRYARKQAWYTYAELRGGANREDAERRASDNNALKEAPGDYERGLFTQGWVYQGFIEDAAGDLRPQSQEETLYCMGCHGDLGVTSDTTFAFARKLDGTTDRHGWLHWSQRDVSGVPEPMIEVVGEGVYPEYSYYLMQTRSGSDYLTNPELSERFFDADGRPKQAAFARLHDDISLALLPSPERAMRLNKAYRTIVEDQDFIQGRDVTTDPVDRLMPVVRKDLPTGVERAIKTRAVRD